MKKKQKNKKQPQQPAMNDEICFYSLVLYLLHCVHRLYKFIFDMLTFLFIFDMLTFFLGFWDATSYLMSPGESLKDCPSSNCRTYLLHTLYTAKYQFIYYGIIITKKFIDVQYKITHCIDRITVTYTWNCHFQ